MTHQKSTMRESEQHILDPIPYTLEDEHLLSAMRIKPNSRNAREILELAQAARSIAKPRALFRVVYIDEKGEDYVVLDGQIFQSRVLRANLEKAHRAFPYVVTSGVELEAWAQSFEDLLHRYLADGVNQVILSLASQVLIKHLEDRYRIPQLASMQPGSLPDWPIEEQNPLFSLLGQPYELIGVRLTESMLMVPSKSVSGILFPNSHNFFSCQLCPRENCTGRRAPFDSDLYAEHFHAQ